MSSLPGDGGEARSTGVITLLFTDLADAATLDADDFTVAEAARRAHFRLARDAVAAHGGTDLKHLATGLMSTFPSALDAVSCAIEVHDGAARHNRREEPRLNVRVGLHVGEPIRDEDDYFGLPVLVVTRLCHEAASGDVLISALVRELVGTRANCDFVDRGRVELRGVPEGVAAFALEWKASVVDDAVALPPTLVTDGRTPFVGRTDQLDVLQRLRAHSLGAGPRLALIAGEPGVGKSRLAAEFARGALDAGNVVLHGRCEDDSLIPYQPFVEALRPRAGGDVADALPVNLLEGRVPGPAERLHTDTDVDRYWLFEDVVARLLAAAGGKPLVLVLDDLQWADRMTLLLLRHVVRHQDLSSLLVVGTYRHTELSSRHPLLATQADLRRDQRVERITLRGLPADDVAQLVAHLTDEHVPDAFVAALYAETEGNPFFIEEVLRHLIETGVVYRGESGRLTSDVAIEDLGLPEGVREAVERRLRLLPEAANELLTLASVVGREFDLATLAAAVDRSEDEIIDALDTAGAAGLISETTADPGGDGARGRAALGRYRFAHALIRQTLYDGLSGLRQARLHRRVGEALERVHAGQIDDHIGELATHFLRATAGGDPVKAIDYATRAGDAADSRLSYERAASYYERALELIDEADDAGRLALLLRIGRVRSRSGEVAAARATFAEAARRARAVGDATSLAYAALGLGGGTDAQLVAGVVDLELVDALEAALDALPADDSALRVRVMARLATALYWSSDDDRRTALAEGAVDIARRIDDWAALSVALSSLRYARWDPDDVARRIELGEEVQRLAEQTGDSELILQALRWRAMYLLELGDVDALDAAIQAHVELADSIRQPLYQAYSSALRGSRLLMKGDFAGAQALASSGMALAERVGSGMAGALCGAQLFYAWLETGQLEGLEQLLADLAAEGSFGADYPAAQAGLALIRARIGKEDQARADVARLVADNFAAIPRDVTWLISLSLLTETVAILGDAATAARLYQELAPFESRNIVAGPPPSVCFGPASYYLGRAALAMGDRGAALAHLRDAIDLARRMGSEPLIARSEVAYADAVLGGDEHDDRARDAEAMLLGAAEAGRRLGMKPLVDDAERLRARG